MADLATITVGSTTYNISDATARTNISTLNSGLSAVEDAIEHDCIAFTATLSSLPTTISKSAITSGMSVISAVFGTPNNIGSDISWTTSNGSLALSGTLNGSTTATFILAKSESV